MLFEMGMDTNTVIAGLLHDVVEDCDGITVEDIAREFGTDIAEMVDGVTKLTKTGKSDIISKEEAQAENLRKMFLAIAKDVRVVIIKLTDRLHNMRTLEYCKPEKRQRKAREVLDVYAAARKPLRNGRNKVRNGGSCLPLPYAGRIRRA